MGRMPSNNVLSFSPKEANFGDTDYPFLSFIPQYETERILEDALREKGVVVEYGLSVDDLSQNDSFVTTKLRRIQDGNSDNKAEEVVVTSSFTLACDGGRSKCREILGIPMKRAKSKTYFYVADVTLSGSGVNELGDDNNKCLHAFLHKTGIMIMFALPKENSFRLLAQTPDGVTNKSNAKIDEKVFQELLLDVTGMNFDVELEDWRSIFEITHGVADRYQENRVFLAGDACHVHSPIGGQGMNYGMSDAVSLIWKLAWAKRCSERFNTNESDKEAKNMVSMILKSYETERKSLGDALIATVEFGTMMMTSRNPIVQFIRNIFMSIAIWFGLPLKVVLYNVGQLGIKYKPSASQFILEQKSWDNFVCSPGERLPNLLLSDGSRLHSHLNGIRHTWIFLNMDKPKDLLFGIEARPSEDQNSYHSIAKSILKKQQVLLVRPDMHVAGVHKNYENLLTCIKEIVGERGLLTL